MGAKVSMCRSDPSNDCLNKSSKDNSKRDEKPINNGNVKEKEIKLTVINGDVIKTEFTYSNNYEITFRKDGYVVRIYSLNKISYTDILKAHLFFKSLVVSPELFDYLYKPPMSLRESNMEFDEEVEQEFFKIENGKICEKYESCEAKKFYLILKKEIASEPSNENVIVLNDLKSSNGIKNNQLHSQILKNLIEYHKIKQQTLKNTL